MAQTQTRISEDIKQAMKAKEELRLSVLRMAQSALKNKRIDAMRDLTDEDEMGVLRTLVKQYQDALGDFKKGNRADLAERTEAEIQILNAYLPAAPSEEEVRAAVKEKIEELGAAGPQDFGKVMGAVMKALGGRAGGDQVSKLVKEELSLGV
ncbi:MAG: GatB/YqeY domain-containing protein [bacterium]|nr:GatB/YqeY domain-containing protein [bacterium]